MMIKQHFMKISVITGLLSFVFLVVGLRNVLGIDVDSKSFIGFAIFSLIIGILSGSLLFYGFTIAYTFFSIGLAIGFIEMYRNFQQDLHGMGSDIGLLSLFIISSFGLGLGLMIEFITKLIRKNSTK